MGPLLFVFGRASVEAARPSVHRFRSASGSSGPLRREPVGRIRAGLETSRGSPRDAPCLQYLSCPMVAPSRREGDPHHPRT